MTEYEQKRDEASRRRAQEWHEQERASSRVFGAIAGVFAAYLMVGMIILLIRRCA